MAYNLPQVIHSSIRWDRETALRLEDPVYLDGYGIHVFSENDEDGIIHEIFSRIGITDSIFAEAALERGVHCNCEHLLINGWTGKIFCPSPELFCQAKAYYDSAVSSGKLDLICSAASGPFEIDYLSIDSPKNSYRIAERLKSGPNVVSVRYNAKFPPYDVWIASCDDMEWDGSDYFGASLKAFEEMFSEKGYQLVGTNYAGTTAFFVKSKLARGKFPLPATAQDLYNPYRRVQYDDIPDSVSFLGNGQEYIDDPFAGRNNADRILFSNGFIFRGGKHILSSLCGSIYLKSDVYLPRKICMRLSCADTVNASVRVYGYTYQRFVLSPESSCMEVIVEHDFVKDDTIRIDIVADKKTDLIFTEEIVFVV